ncbi:hypothetical protein [Pirellulimonas nuda]|nr:hypothetical protein [Pirellulimonas nuda]
MAIVVLDHVGLAGVPLAREFIGATRPFVKCATQYNARSVLPNIRAALAADGPHRALLAELAQDSNIAVREWAFGVIVESNTQQEPLFSQALKPWTDFSDETISGRHFRIVAYLAEAKVGSKALPAASLAVRCLEGSINKKCAATDLLEDIGEQALPAVKAAFASASASQRRRAAIFVGNCPEFAASLKPEVEHCLEDPDTDVQIAAAFAWWNLTHDTSRIESVLIAGLHSASGITALSVVETIGGEKAFLIPTWRELLPRYAAKGRILWQLTQAGPRRIEAVPEIRSLLHGADPAAAASACWALEAFGLDDPAESVEVLSGWLPKTRGMDRYAVLGALPRYGSLAKPMLPLLAEELNSGMSQKAADVLAAIGEDSLPVLEEALKSDRSGVRQAAQSAIDSIHAKKHEVDLHDHAG